jgi:mevalonate kinase
MAYSSSAPAKMILSGEYAVVFGYKGIAVPTEKFMTTARWESGNHPMMIKLQGISGESGYIEHIVELCKKSGGPTTGTLTVTNSIPLGKGMGSSTAAVIAVGRCLLSVVGVHEPQLRDDALVREKILAIEDVINPGHSGLDFAVIWGNVPICFQKGRPPCPMSHVPCPMDNAELIDTGSPDQTTPELVAWVTQRLAQGDTAVSKALQAIGDCTERLLKGESPFTVFPDHTQAQIALGVVPPKVQELIEKIEAEGGVAKVLGAGGRSGGGGMVLKIGAPR